MDQKEIVPVQFSRTTQKPQIEATCTKVRNVFTSLSYRVSILLKCLSLLKKHYAK